MLRRPPRSTLFPTRRSSDLVGELDQDDPDVRGHRDHHLPVVLGLVLAMRSEEHTSELQSHHDLVCRLLLEKKKNSKKRRRRPACLRRTKIVRTSLPHKHTTP